MKKLLSILMAAAMLLSLCALTACGGTTEEPAEAEEAAETETAETEEAAETTETAEPAELTTIEAGKLTISTSPDFPPFEYTDDSGAVIGIEPEIMTIICEKLGLELQIDAMDFDSALMAAGQGKSDAVVSGVTITEERRATYDFTDSYTTITQAIVAPEGSGITMDNLGDYKIGVQRGTTGHIYTEDDFGDQVVAYDTYSLVFQALNNGQVDCIVMDDAVAVAYMKTNPGLEMTETTYEPENYGFGFHKGNQALVDAVNECLAELKGDGTIQSILDKYMSEE